MIWSIEFRVQRDVISLFQRIYSKYRYLKMKRKNKIRRFAPKFTGNFVKIGEKCRDCVHSDESTNPVATIRCACNKPKTSFQPKIGWICYSFSEKMLCKNEEDGGNNIDR